MDRWAEAKRDWFADKSITIEGDVWDMRTLFQWSTGGGFQHLRRDDARFWLQHPKLPEYLLVGDSIHDDEIKIALEGMVRDAYPHYTNLNSSSRNTETSTPETFGLPELSDSDVDLFSDSDVYDATPPPADRIVLGKRPADEDDTFGDRKEGSRSPSKKGESRRQSIPYRRRC